MKRTIFILAISLIFYLQTNAQSIKETFDSNSLEWTECSFESSAGRAIIDKGVMTVTSKGEKKGASLLLGAQVGVNTFFETHCYAPIDVKKPFKIKSKVKIQRLDADRIVGVVFNYRDGGNYYCMNFNDEMVSFLRYENNELVGYIDQDVKWNDMKKTEQEWELISDGQIISFIVDGVQIMKVRYMPLEYSGFGYYTFGKQKLIIDEVEFIQQ